MEVRVRTPQFLEILYDSLKECVDREAFDSAVRYARAKAGGYAKAASVQARRDEIEKSAVSKLVIGEPITALSDVELLVLTDKVG